MLKQTKAKTDTVDLLDINAATADQFKAVGIDTASIDSGQSTKFKTHVALLSQNVPVFENLSDLRDLPDRGFDVIALPMKIAGGTGGPLRVLAVLPPSH